jgi:DNA-binding MarR family transcriptional regulator
MSERMKTLYPANEEGGGALPELPLDRSVGYQIRRTHRMVQRALQLRIEAHGVTLGMWYFLRALWDEDGLTQRELSDRVGTMEPTTLSAIALMERSGFVHRARNVEDRRKVNVYLTDRGRALQRELLPAGIAVVETATRTFSPRELQMFLSLLGEIQKSLREDLQAHNHLNQQGDLGGEP